MRFIYLVILAFALVSCKKEVQLAKANRTIDSLVVDHTPVYLFFEVKDSDTLVKVNRNNTISTTNWIFNVDKRLPLKLAIPEVIKLQNKRKNDDVHTEDIAGNYYSYTDSIQRSLAFLSFKQFNYTYDSYFSSIYVKENPEYHMHFQTYYINFKSNKTITVDGNEVSQSELLAFLNDYIAFSGEGKRNLIYLNFDEELSFDTYLSNVVLLSELENETTQIATTHFIYNKKKLPDCNCY